MKTLRATSLAMLAAWAVPIACGGAWQLATSGMTSDLGVWAEWVGAFTLLTWIVVIAPLRRWLEETPFFSDWHWSWLGWGVLATAVYSVTVPLLLGADAFIILWYPAMMGGIAGVVFAILLRPRNSSPS